MYKSVNGQSPMYLKNMFQFCSDQHSLLTRSITSLNLVPPLIKIQLFKHSFTYQGIVIWNSLLLNMKMAPSLSTFILYNLINNCGYPISKTQHLVFCSFLYHCTYRHAGKWIKTTKNKHISCSDDFDPRVTSSSPFPAEPKEVTESWSHSWPTAVWQCFIQGK